jgi:nucleotidyltransferase substrate binding protein (TIGR01987 family)
LDATQPLVVDGTIQRFEFVFELFWKTLVHVLEHEGIEASTPREALRKAYAARLLEDEQDWLQMLADRNATSHVYDEEAALRIYESIRLRFPAIERGHRSLLERLASSGSDPDT